MDAPSSTNIFLFEEFRLDRCSGNLARRDECGVFTPLAIGSRAVDILGVLVERPGDLVSRAEIISAVWPETIVEDNNLNVHIAALRRLLDEGRENGSCIQTIPGRGYRFAIPVSHVDFFAPLASGRGSGNGAGGPIAERPESQKPSAPNLPGKRPPVVPLRERKWLWCGSLGLVAGAVCLLAALVTLSDWRLPQSSSARPPRLSIVVLPFTDLSDDRDGQNLANRLTGEVTTDLSRISGMVVISRNTAFASENKFVGTRQIGRELGVSYALEGSVQRSGIRVRVNTQLIDAETGATLWAERFDGNTGDLFAMQDDITRRMAIALDLELTNRAAGRLTEHGDALDYIVRGRAALNVTPSRDSYAKAISLFERALLLDPGSVEAKGRLGWALVERALRQGMADSPAADLTRAEDLIGEALAASPLDAQAHYAKGALLRVRGRPEEAAFEFETVLAGDRNRVGAWFHLGWCKLMTGSIDEAIPLEEQLIHLSPRDPYIADRYLRMGWVHLIQSHIDEAILWLEKARSANPRFLNVRPFLASAYALNGETERGAAELGEARRLKDDGSFSSISRIARGYWGVPKTRALIEATYFAGLRKAGVPEE